MIFNGQLEVCQGNGNEGCDDDEDDEDNEEDGVDGVDFVAPHAGKNVVQLDVDGAERQEACKFAKAVKFACRLLLPKACMLSIGSSWTQPA